MFSYNFKLFLFYNINPGTTDVPIPTSTLPTTSIPLTSLPTLAPTENTNVDIDSLIAVSDSFDIEPRRKKSLQRSSYWILKGNIREPSKNLKVPFVTFKSSSTKNMKLCANLSNWDYSLYSWLKNVMFIRNSNHSLCQSKLYTVFQISFCVRLDEVPVLVGMAYLCNLNLKKLILANETYSVIFRLNKFNPKLDFDITIQKYWLQYI